MRWEREGGEREGEKEGEREIKTGTVAHNMHMWHVVQPSYNSTFSS